MGAMPVYVGTETIVEGRTWVSRPIRFSVTRAPGAEPEPVDTARWTFTAALCAGGRYIPLAVDLVADAPAVGAPGEPGYLRRAAQFTLRLEATAAVNLGRAGTFEVLGTRVDGTRTSWIVGETRHRKGVVG